MLGKILKLFVGDKSKKDLKLINPIIEQIHSFEQVMNSLSNDELSCLLYTSPSPRDRG